jgi:hypothetical protein
MYNETVAKDAYVLQLAEYASTQELSEDLRTRVRALSIAFCGTMATGGTVRYRRLADRGRLGNFGREHGV